VSKTTIYISYAWGDAPESEENLVVDALYKALTGHGFEVVIDRKDLDYAESLLHFFEVIGTGGIVIPIVGRKYLTRPNCLIEAANMVIRGDIKERIFPLILSNCYDVYSVLKRAGIIKEVKEYWQAKENELKEVVKFNDDLAHSFIPIREDLNLVSQIIATITIFIDHIGNAKQFNMDDEINNGFGDFITYLISKTETDHRQTFYEKPPGKYFGRQEDIKFIDDFLADDSRHFLLLYGVGGMGKTHLLSICLEKFNYARKFYWVKADENFDLIKLYEECEIRYPKELERMPPNESQGLHNIQIHFLNEFSAKKLFLIIDDYYEITDPNVRELLPQLAALPSGKILIISRQIPQNIEALKVESHEVEELSKEDFLTAMNVFALNFTKKFTKADLGNIYEKSRGYPLGGRLIINLADANPDISLDDILRDIVKFDAEIDPDGREFSRKLLNNIFSRGNKAEIEILTEFSALFGFSSMEDIRQLPSFRLREFLTLVRRRRFITTDGNGKFNSHPMIRDFSYDKLEGKEMVHQKLGSYFEGKLKRNQDVEWEIIESTIQHYSRVNQKELTDFGKRIQVQFGLSNVMTLIEESSKNTVRNLNAMLAISPDNLYYLHRLGMAYRAMNNLEGSINSYRKAISIEPDNVRVLNELGISYRERRKEGDIDLAIATFNKAISIEPRALPSLNELGISYRERRKEGDIDLAIATFNKAISIEPDNVRVLNELGISYRERRKEGDIDLAIATFNKAISIEPRALPSLNELGISYRERRKEGDIDLAIATFIKANEVDPKHLPSLNELGISYRLKGIKERNKAYYSKSIEQLLKAKKIEPDNVKILTELGKSYSYNNDLANTVLICEKALELNKYNMQTYTILYNAYKHFHQIPKGIEIIKRGLRVKPKDRILNSIKEELIAINRWE
jgi:tetratricopeptide (TPR) repeat protein